MADSCESASCSGHLELFIHPKKKVLSLKTKYICLPKLSPIPWLRLDVESDHAKTHIEQGIRPASLAAEQVDGQGLHRLLHSGRSARPPQRTKRKLSPPCWSRSRPRLRCLALSMLISLRSFRYLP